MSGHTYTHDNYYNPRCARVNFCCWGGGNFYEEEGNGLEYRQSNINKHRKTESCTRVNYRFTQSRSLTHAHKNRHSSVSTR